MAKYPRKKELFPNKEYDLVKVMDRKRFNQIARSEDMKKFKFQSDISVIGHTPVMAKSKDLQKVAVYIRPKLIKDKPISRKEMKELSKILRG